VRSNIENVFHLRFDPVFAPVVIMEAPILNEGFFGGLIITHVEIKKNKRHTVAFLFKFYPLGQSGLGLHG